MAYDVQQLKKDLEAQASWVDYTVRVEYYAVIGKIQADEGQSYALLRAARPKEYCLVGWLDEVTQAELCRQIYTEVLKDRPRAPAALIWRVAPKYSIEAKTHKVYLRVGWLEYREGDAWPT